MANSYLDVLKWRGMLHQSTPGVEEQLANNSIGYIGFDPTSTSLHIGSLAVIMMTVHFQRAGHTPILLLGGATGMIGDPSGKNAERNLLGIDEIKHNSACIKKQLSHFLAFEDVPNKAVMVNNADWFGDMYLLDFLRETGKHITVSYMIKKDSVQSRMESGISYAEFTYQLIQAYDFYHLHKNYDCSVQLGGADQWGNITTGTELVRRMGGKQVHAITSPLITRPDGSKFGKSEGENIWLDPEKTSPYRFYQFWLNLDDEEVLKLIKVFSLKSRAEIEQIIVQSKEMPHARIAQKELAEELTLLVHGQDALQKALSASQILFGKSSLDVLRSLEERDFLDIFKDVPRTTLSKTELTNSHAANGLQLAGLFTQVGATASNSEAKRMVKGGGISINKEKAANGDLPITTDMLLNDRYLLLQVGKKKYYLVTFE